MKAGPKAQRSLRALPAVAGEDDAARCAAWVERWLRVPRGTGAGAPLVLRPWQRAIVDELLAPETRQCVLVLPRGNGKTGLSAAVGLWHLFDSGVEGARVVVVATDERRATRLLEVAARMVAMSEPLTKRAQTYRDRLVVPRSDSQFLALPAEQARVEGEDVTLGVVDEVGFTPRPVYESVLLGCKRPGARVLAVGTPSTPQWREQSPLLDLVTEARLHPSDRTLRLIEHTAPAHLAIDDPAAWEAANPALDDLLAREHLAASLPPRTRRSEYERARLGRWIDEGDEGWLPPGAWAERTDARDVPDGADVVLSLDGSFSQDATGLLVAEIGAVPHLDVVDAWEAPDNDPDFRVDVLAVEDAIRAACRRWRVREVCADPFRWQRSLQVLAREGLPVSEFPQTQARMSPATTSLREAVLNGAVTHSGDARLARHAGNAVLRDDARGVRLAKPSKHSKRRIDLAVCAVMAHSRAQFYGTRAPKQRKRVVSW